MAEPRDPSIAENVLADLGDRLGLELAGDVGHQLEQLARAIGTHELTVTGARELLAADLDLEQLRELARFTPEQLAELLELAPLVDAGGA